MLAAFSAAGFFVHTPFGPRKSGMPESVEMPAPVSTTTRSAPAIALAAAASAPESTSVGGSPVRPGDRSTMARLWPGAIAACRSEL